MVLGGERRGGVAARRKGGVAKGRKGDWAIGVAHTPIRLTSRASFHWTAATPAGNAILAMRLWFAWFLGVNVLTASSSAVSLNTVCLQTKLRPLVSHINGRVGICVSDGQRAISQNGGQQFPLHSVFKLPVAVAILDAVDHGHLHLDDIVTIRQSDLGMGIQPLAKLVGPNGFKTTINDLLVRMIVDSDGAATDFLIAKVGGPSAVQKTLVQKGLRGFNIDRDERDLGAEETGLRWDPKYVDEKVLDQANKGVSNGQRDHGFHASQHHDTATPDAVGTLLQWLANGTLLSPRSSALLLETMVKTRTFPDRLKAGVPEGWLLAHKTGTSSTWKGVTGATNDVGILMAPDASTFVVAVVFIANSRNSDNERAQWIADVARAIGDCSE